MVYYVKEKHSYSTTLYSLSLADTFSTPINVAYVSPAVTTYPYMNSAYRVYELEPDTLSVINHHTYILDIEKANARGNGTYELEYSAKVYSQ